MTDEQVFYRNIGLRVKAIREENNLSQSDLAQILQVYQPDISRLENGTQGISLYQLHVLCTKLSVPSFWLLDLRR